MYSIASVPEAIPVTTPPLLTVARAVFVDDHTPPLPVVESVILFPSQMDDAPVIVPGSPGSGDTVTIAVAATLPQPFVTV